MKKNLLPISKLYLLLISVFFIVSCNDSNENQSLDTSLCRGNDLSSYVSVTADVTTKKSSIEISQNGSWKLFSGKNTDAIIFDTPILQGSTLDKTELANTFQIYCLEWADGSRYTFGLRQLPIEGQPNLRDLGGYKTTDGKFVKWGLVFRSGKCNNLTDDDLTYLSSMPLKTIIDFRSNSEKNSEPDRIPESVQIQKHLPIDPGNLSSVNITEAIATGNVQACKQYMIDLNEMLIKDFQEEYKTYFAMLMDKSNTPLMFHCTAGKDRAGLGAALFLASLGVDRETILQDYLLTNTLTNATLENMEAQYGKTDMAACMYYVYSVQREYIGKAFETIEMNYSSVDKFLTDQLNVDLKKMRELYLY